MRKHTVPGFVTLTLTLIIGPAAAAAGVAASEPNGPGISAREVSEVLGFTGSEPRGIAVTPDSQRVLVANYASSDISVIDSAAGRQVGSVTGYSGSSPMRVAVSPDGTTAYVSNMGSATLSIIDIASASEVGTVGGVYSPVGVAVTPDGSTAYVTSYSQNSVYVIDLDSRSVAGRVTQFTGRLPTGITISPDGAAAYVTHWGKSGVTVIDTATNHQIREASGYTGTTPGSPVVSPDGRELYVSNEESPWVSVFDTSTLSEVATIPAGSSSSALAMSDDGRLVLATDIRDNGITLIDTVTRTQFGTVEGYTGDQPQGIALSPDGATAWVGGMRSGSISKIAIEAVAAHEPPGTPAGIAANPGDTKATVTWSPPEDHGSSPVIDHVLQQSRTGSDAWEVIAETPQTRAEVQGLENGVEHHYRIAARSAHGQSTWTEHVSVTPAAPAGPTTPVDPVAPEIDPAPIPERITEVADTGKGGAGSAVPAGTTGTDQLAFTGMDPSGTTRTAAILLIAGTLVLVIKSLRRQQSAEAVAGSN